MTEQEKWDLLEHYQQQQSLDEADYALLEKLARDKDPALRSEVAILLVLFVQEKSKQILCRLARDTDALVRTEAFDSLCVFADQDNAAFLKQAVQTEPDDLARSYAIESWADVMATLEEDRAAACSFLYGCRKAEESGQCLLSIAYGLYILGEESALGNILSFLDAEDYHLRCGAIHLLEYVANTRNKRMIRQALEKRLCTEESKAVCAGAHELLKVLENVT